MTTIAETDAPALGDDAVPERAGAAAAAVGTRGFHPALLRLAASQVPHRTAMAYHYWRFGAPTVVVSPFSEAESDPYIAGYFRFDPFYRYWRESAEAGVVSIARLAAGRERHADYMRTMVYDWGLADEVGVFLPSLGGAALGLFMDRGDDVYGDADIARLERLYPLLEGLHAAHEAVRPDGAPRELTAEYREKAQEIIDIRLYEAGVRLALTLDGLFCGAAEGG